MMPASRNLPHPWVANRPLNRDRTDFARHPALADLYETALNWRLWTRLGWRDIRARYRRTVLGPFWTVASAAILIVSLGMVYSLLWRIDVKTFLPYFSAGLISWVLMTTIINESCSALIGAEAIIKSLRLPYAIHIGRVVWRNILVFLHSLIVHAVVLLYFKIVLSPAQLVLIPVGLSLLIVNCFWISLLVSVACARFRDITQVVSSVLQIAFFVTPIFWPLDQLGNAPIARFVLADVNVLYHMVDVVRAPLHGEYPDPLSYLVLVLVAALGWFGTLWFFGRFRARIPYWV